MVDGHVDLNRVGGTPRRYGVLFDPSSDYADLMEPLFDFDAIRRAQNPNLTAVAPCAVTGPM
jgi:phosphoglucomutase